MTEAPRGRLRDGQFGLPRLENQIADWALGLLGLIGLVLMPFEHALEMGRYDIWLAQTALLLAMCLLWLARLRVSARFKYAGLIIAIGGVGSLAVIVHQDFSIGIVFFVVMNLLAAIHYRLGMLIFLLVAQNLYLLGFLYFSNMLTPTVWVHEVGGTLFGFIAAILVQNMKIHLAERNALLNEQIAQLTEKNILLQRFRKMLDANQDALYMARADDARFVDCNAAVERQDGFSHDELLKLRVIDVDPNLDTLEKWSGLVESLRAAGNMEIESTGLRKDGSHYPMHLALSWYEDESGGYVVAMGRDIGAMKQQQALLQDALDQRNEAQRVAMIGNWSWNLADNQLEGSDQMYALYELPMGPAPELASVIALVHPEDRVRFQSAFDAAARDFQAFDLIYRLQFDDGHEKTLVIMGHPVHDASGRCVEFRGVVQDITQMKESERATQAALAEVERSRDAMRAFITNISHELRTPLNGIVGINQLLLNSVGTDKERQMLQQSQRAAGQLMALLNDLLDLAKMQAGKLTISQQPFCLHEVVQPILDYLSVTLEGSPVSLHRVFAPHLPNNLIGDEIRLRQVLLNLAGNAAKFTRAGEVTLQVRAIQIEDDAVTLEFGVLDTGIGISDAHLPRLFTPFSQVDQGDDRSHNGTGLGLALSSELVQLMGGKLEASSEPGVGSHFSFRLTLKRGLDGSEEVLSQAMARMRRSDKRVDTSWSHAELVGQKILVADDNVLNRTVAHDALTLLGAEVQFAENGQQAVAMLNAANGQQESAANPAAEASTKPFTLVLMDLQMPEMDGYQATAALRRIPGLEALPIIAVSARSSEDTHRACLQAGMNAYISKPYAFDDLLQLIRAQCGLPPPEAAGRAPEARAGMNAVSDAGLDVARAIRDLGGQRETYLQLVGQFLEMEPALLEALGESLRQGLLLQASRQVHALAGSTAVLGAAALTKWLVALEKTFLGPAEALDLDAIEAGLRHRFGALCLALQDFVAAPPPGD